MSADPMMDFLMKDLDRELDQQAKFEVPKWQETEGIVRTKLSGRQVNLLKVHGLRVKNGRYGPISTGEYAVTCACGKQINVKYAQIYYKTIYSCGCRPRPKHPPIRLEGQTIGLIEVMRWAEEENAWEVVCLECGALIYRRRTSEVREAGESCETHHQVHLDPSK